MVHLTTVALTSSDAPVAPIKTGVRTIHIWNSKFEATQVASRPYELTPHMGNLFSPTLLVDPNLAGGTKLKEDLKTLSQAFEVPLKTLCLAHRTADEKLTA